MSGKIRKHGGAVCLAASAMLLLGLGAAGCAGDEVARTVDATVTLDLPDSMPVGSPFDIGYTWTPAADFQPPADDYKIFVHFVDPDGNIVEQDDHYPPVPTSQWKAGEPVSYRHWVYPEPDVRPDYFDIYVGMYEEDTMEQVATLHDGRFENRPLVHSVVVRQDDQGGVPVFVEGFEEREVSLTAENPFLQSWQWMHKRGVVAFGNPHGPATLHLRALSPVDFLEDRTQTVTIKVGDRVVGTYQPKDSAPYLVRFEIPGDDLGDGDWVDFTVEVDKTFVPAQVEEGSDDIRELGLQVYWMYLQR